MTRSEKLKALLAAEEEREKRRRERKKVIKADIAKAQSQETKRRYQLIGQWVDEAGILDWDIEHLKTGFREMAKNGAKYYERQGVAEVIETDVAAD